MKKAFTLIELIIVIGIIAILASVMFASFGGGTESARAAKCLNNMRSLAQGVISYGVSTRAKTYPPLAGSLAVIRIGGNGKVYEERPGWISWLSMNDEYGTRTQRKSSPKNFIALDNVSAYCRDLKKAEFAITNGTIWTSVNCNHECYVCPSHQIAARKKGATVNWSYVMNCYFGYDSSDGGQGFTDDGHKSLTDSSVRRERRLLFAELPIYGTGPRYDEGGTVASAEYPDAASTKNDCVLQYRGYEFNKKWKGAVETIAFNHKNGKRYCAHVVFADGHTEKLMKPKSGAGVTEEQLTALLCAGKDIGFDGSSYTWINTDDTKNE